MHRARLAVPLLTASALALATAGCAERAVPAAVPTATEADTAHGDQHGAAAGWGAPAEADAADRTVEVTANDDLSYVPSTIEVEVGETVTFVVTNAGQAVHEFVLGPEQVQDEHEAAMREHVAEGGTMEHEEPNTLSLAAGETGELTWHFTEPGAVLFGCHEPGHYGGGMIGVVQVTG